MDAILEEGYVSIITKIEILGWCRHTQPLFEKTKGLLNYFSEIPLNDVIANLCIQLRTTKRIKLPDAIIVATALYLGLPLVTVNTSDFSSISNLQIINLFDLFP